MPYIIEKTFNSKIFKKVGNPTITDDGIASGFSSSNGINTSFSAITSSSSIIIKERLVYSSTPNTANGAQVIFQIVGHNSNPTLQYEPSNSKFVLFRCFNASSTTTAITKQLQNGDIIESEVILTSSSAVLNIKVNGVNYTSSASGNGLYCGYFTQFKISNNNNYYWTGSIDLKQSSIIVDGKIVLNGTTSKEVYVLPSIQELKDYYSNTLIVQYNGKPKAKATIEMLVDLVFDNVILDQIRAAFDWKTAVGKQLDIIGEWVGVSRSYNIPSMSGRVLFSYPETSKLIPDDITTTAQFGYANYPQVAYIDENATEFSSSWLLDADNNTITPEKGKFYKILTAGTYENKLFYWVVDEEDANNSQYKEVPVGGIIRYDDLKGIDSQLNDDDYKVVIGLKIIYNSINHTAGEIDNAIWEYFNQTIYTTWSPHILTYNVPADYMNLMQVCLYKGVLPAPIGTEILLTQI